MVAPACRWKPSSSMTRRTRSAVAGLTPDSSLTTRDTVLIDTAARRATSAIVGRPPPSDDDWYAPWCDNVGTGSHYPAPAPAPSTTSAEHPKAAMGSGRVPGLNWTGRLLTMARRRPSVLSVV